MGFCDLQYKWLEHANAASNPKLEPEIRSGNETVKSGAIRTGGVRV